MLLLINSVIVGVSVSPLKQQSHENQLITWLIAGRTGLQRNFFIALDYRQYNWI